MKKIKFKNLILTFATAVCLATTTGVLVATHTAEKDFINQAKADTVDIKLDEFSISDGKEVSYSNSDKINMPGDQISKIPRISNKASDCYIRVKYDFFMDNPDLKGIDTTNLVDFSTENWIKCDDGYYYYTEIFNENANIDLFKGVTIPSSWGNEYAEQKFKINITAEAIQSKNFTPNFDSQNPWNGEKTELCVRTREFTR